jgi:UDP-GlcNAc3NAcA epimerase
VVSRELRRHEAVHEILVHTGQHYDSELSSVFFEELDIPVPDHNLEVGSLGHGAQTGRMLEGLEAIMTAEAPDWVVVFGDTNSTLAGALAAAKLHIPVAHVEAGLRSWNRRMPEELNRVLADHLSSELFAPTSVAVENLAREGINGPHVSLVGDVMLDALRFYSEQAEKSSTVLGQLGLAPGFVLATVHRAENTEDPQVLKVVMEALATVPIHLPVILPLHPRTRKLLHEYGLEPKIHGDLRVIDPVSYLDMVMLERHASVIVTDSGGVQKEAYFHRVPCVTLRNETEWTELVDAGWNVLCPPMDPQSVAECIRARVGQVGEDVSLYGAGNAATRIVSRILQVGSSNGVPSAGHVSGERP